MKICYYKNENHSTKWEKIITELFHNKEMKSYFKSMKDNWTEKLVANLNRHF